MATVSGCAVISSTTASGVLPTSVATSAEVGPVEGAGDHEDAAASASSRRPAAPETSSSRASATGDAAVDIAARRIEGHHDGGQPPDDLGHPVDAAPRARARVSRRAATGSSTPMSSACSPSRRISPTGTDRVGHAAPRSGGRRGGGAATAMPAAASARAHRPGHGQRIRGIAVHAEGVHRQRERRAVGRPPPSRARPARAPAPRPAPDRRRPNRAPGAPAARRPRYRRGRRSLPASTATPAVPRQRHRGTRRGSTREVSGHAELAHDGRAARRRWRAPVPPRRRARRAA